jgi:hypothetical protein
LITATTPSTGLTRNRVTVGVIFAVIALVSIIGGLALGSLAPVAHLLPQSVNGTGPGHHPLRVACAWIVGAVFAVAAGFTLKRKSQPQPADPNA